MITSLTYEFVELLESIKNKDDDDYEPNII